MCHTKVEGTRSKRLFVFSSLRGIKRPTYNPPTPHQKKKEKKEIHTHHKKIFPSFLRNWGHMTQSGNLFFFKKNCQIKHTKN